MTINKKLQKVIVIDKSNNETVYQKSNVSFENDLTITSIQINQAIQKVYSISTEQNDLIIILSLEEQNNAFAFAKNLSKLFLFYPLIGTENFGFNFLVHSKKFAPTEPRDGIHLKSQNEQIQDKEENNRNLLQETFKLIAHFIENHCSEIQNSHFFSELNFNTNIPNNSLLSDYFKELKRTWVDKFKTFHLVETNENRICPNETLFFSNELLEDDDYFDSIYAIVSLLGPNIPKKEIARKWTEYVYQWEDDNIKFIDIKQVVAKIKETKTLDFYEKTGNTDNLKRFYEYLIKYNHSEIFNQYEILPNIKNEFKLQSQLNSYLDIDDVLIEIADVIISDVPKRYLKKGFEFSLQFEPYEKKQFVSDINGKISNTNENSFDNQILLALIKYCSIFSNEDTKNTRGEFLKLVIAHYQIEQPFINLPNLTEKWWLTPTKSLLRIFIRELNIKATDWIEENIEFLHKLLSVVYDYSEFEEILQALPLFPNQLYKLCIQTDLKKDENIPEELKNLYDEILKPEKQIKEILIHNDFIQFLKNGEAKTPENLGSEIENKLELQSCVNISQHEHIQYILKIIKTISDSSDWAKYFPVIESKKATIMLERVSDNETKNDLFSIIGLDDKDKIALLGELSRQENLEQIIKLGKEALEEKQHNKADFQFKHMIGTHIEKLVRERIGSDLTGFEIKAEEQQGGQDIVIRHNGEIVYYIEVKSRWDNRNSITMSQLQMKSAVDNKDKYSLCCVEMCDYKVGEKEERYNVSEIHEIIDRITVLSDIGRKIEPLLSGILAVKDIDNEISLTGDYRGIIPQSIVKKGSNLDCFVSNLIEKIVGPS